MSIMNDRAAWFSINGEEPHVMLCTAARELQKLGYKVVFIKWRLA